MINAHIRNRSLFSHRRMKTLTDVTQKKPYKKLNQSKQLLQMAKHEYYQNKNLSSAVQLFEQYLLYQGNDNQALYLCGICYLNLNSSMEAIRKLEAISSNFVNKENSYLLLAMAYAKLRDNKKSLTIISQCLAYFPNFQQGICYRAKLYLKSHQFELAQKDFLFGLKLNSKSQICKLALGDCYFQSGKYKMALQYLQESTQNSQINLKDIILKKGICYFQLQQYKQVIYLFEKHYSNNDKSSEIYYYLGMSYLKQQSDKKHQAVLNLQYCIRLQTNKLLMEKAFKILIQLFLTDYQFYQALNLLKLADVSQMECKFWKILVESCMLVIKGHFNQALQKLTQIYKILTNKKQINQQKSIPYQNEFLFQQNLKQSKKDRLSPKQTVEVTKSYRRKSFSLKHVKRHSFYDESKYRSSFKTILEKKNLQKKFNNKNSPIKLKKFFSIKKQKPEQKKIFTQQQEHFIMPIILKFKAYSQFFINNYLRSLDTYQEYQAYMKNVFGKEATEIVYNKTLCQGLLLIQTQLFREALQKFDTAIEQYQTLHNQIPIQPLLYKTCVLLRMCLPQLCSEITQQSQSQSTLQQILHLHNFYKQTLSPHYLSHYLLSLMYFMCQKYVDAQTELQLTLKIVEECTWKILFIKGLVQLILGNYYHAIKEFTAGLILEQTPQLYLARSVAFLLEGIKRKTIQNAKKTLQTANKNKRVNLNKLKQSKKNIKQKKFQLKIPSILLNRQQSDKVSKQKQVNSEVFIQNNFQDLQKFIELESQQQKISLWVTKILYYNSAYQQAARALQKVDQKCDQLIQIEFWLKFYQGEFQQCEQLGLVILNSFQGNILTRNQQLSILTMHNKQIKSTLQMYKISINYQKWLVILHLSKKQQYSLLIKYVKKQISQSQQSQQLIELKYNLGIIYLLLRQKQKAFNCFQALLVQIQNQKLQNKLNKILKLQFDQDQCLSDLAEQLGINENRRLSEYLPYKPLLLKDQKIKRIYIKLSIPFPDFPKINIIPKITQSFLMNQLNLNLVDKKIDAPWIKRNKQKVQFTQQIIDASTDFLKQTKQMNISRDDTIFQ